MSSVRLRPGSGKIDINGRKFEEYFSAQLQRDLIATPFKTCNTSITNYDMIIRVHGGGLEGQAVATRLGIARALLLENDTRKHDLRVLGYLTRDSRRRERKKYGLAGARKRFQFSKR